LENGAALNGDGEVPEVRPHDLGRIEDLRLLSAPGETHMSESGQGGMGMHKHGVSGRAPKNRRALRQLGSAMQRKAAKDAQERAKKDRGMTDSVQKLFKGK
jgi:hypothetical protein